jgi:hypothetical protein
MQFPMVGGVAVGENSNVLIRKYCLKTNVIFVENQTMVGGSKLILPHQTFVYWQVWRVSTFLLLIGG